MFCDRIEISCESVEHVCILHLQDWYKAEAKYKNISSDPASRTPDGPVRSAG